MITRTWHGKTHIDDAKKYLDFLLTDGTKEYRETPGNLSIRVWQRTEGDVCHFWTITEWENIQSIKAFAGEDYEKAKYYDFDIGILREFEKHVTHYETFVLDAKTV